MKTVPEFSQKTRARALERMRSEEFDFLVIGGGITGAAVARDAASRGLSVALVEKNDFAYGTSSRSSKLIHGGLRYLEKMEFKMVFEALAERARLLKTASHMVRPLPFYFPVYQNDPHGKGILGVGMWLYDLLALFRTPGFHRNLSRKKLLSEIPFLKDDGLAGGFQYYDASMWDDALAVETLRASSSEGACVGNYVEALGPVWDGKRVTGYRIIDVSRGNESSEPFQVRARKTIVCAGPWTDEVGKALFPKWKTTLSPSKGVHLVFDLKRIPIPGALVMSHPSDGRISFVIPRPDFGTGVVIVGTTDSPVSSDPGMVNVESSDVTYLMELLARYFPSLQLSTSDILSAYVGVRPLVGEITSLAGSEGQRSDSPEPNPDTQESAEERFTPPAPAGKLQNVSREHSIWEGPGQTVFVAGGKYTTHRTMAEEIVEFALSHWKKDARKGRAPEPPKGLKAPETKSPVNPAVNPGLAKKIQARAGERGLELPSSILERYGEEGLELAEIHHLEILPRYQRLGKTYPADPDGFEWLQAQLVYQMRKGMVLRLEDFYIRRLPLYLSRADHGLPWLDGLSEVWADEMGVGNSERFSEAERLRSELNQRSSWSVHLE